MSNASHAQSYEAHAKRLREEAAQASSPFMAHLLEEAARQYEMLADSIERMAKQRGILF